MNNPLFLGSRNESFIYELLTQDDNNIYKVTNDITNIVISCNMSIDFSRDIITNCTINLKDDDNIINYFEDLIRISYVINETKISVATICLSQPKKSSDGKIITRSITSYDLLLFLDQDLIESSVSYLAGVNVIDTINTLIDTTGIGINIEDSEEVLTENMVFELGTSKLKIINDLLKTIGYESLSCNGNGQYQSRIWSQNNNIIWNFYDDAESLYVSDIDSDVDYSTIFNKIIVVSNKTEADTEPTTYTITFEDENLEAHPLSYTSIGRYITKKIDQESSSAESLTVIAKRELYKQFEVEQSINYKHAFIGLPRIGDCYNFKNTILDIDSTFRIESFSWELKTGEMLNSVIRRVLVE